MLEWKVEIRSSWKLCFDTLAACKAAAAAIHIKPKNNDDEPCPSCRPDYRPVRPTPVYIEKDLI